MGRLCDTTKIVALGLLNYADDDGYFYADPRMVRAAIRPLDDDSKATATAINELASSGDIEVRKHSTHGAVGRITAFKRHQVINRPNKSMISHLFAESFTEQSRSDHGAITDESVGEGKGMEQGMEQGNGEEGNQAAGDVVKEPKAPKPPKATDAEWLASLKTSPAYTGIDIEREHAKAAMWCETKRRNLSRAFFINWLNRAEKPMSGTNSKPLNIHANAW